MTERRRDLHKKPSGNMSQNSFEQENMDYYKSHANNKRGPTAVKGAKPKKKPIRASSNDRNASSLESDQSKWIHRDKLKEIEIREMEEAGFRVGRSSRSNSRSQSARRRSRSRRSSSVEAGHNGDEHMDTRKVVSPIPAEDEEEYEQQQMWGSPNHEEYIDSQPNSPRAAGHNGRPSTSRIPLPKTSGLPAPTSVTDREAPLPRSRAGSENWNGDIAANGARVRSGSVGSQALLDEPYDDRQVTPPFGHKRNLSAGANGSPPKSPQKSPMKAKTPGKPGSAVGARKTSAAKSGPKPRQASTTTPPSKRPGTSGGSASRPTTSHRPEGEAPWLATMYKPDPRLPPDQQIIPTHAKRMQQEQWETEGRVGSMYDKDFRLLNTDEPSDKRLSQINPIDLEKARENEQWPLPSPTKLPNVENEKDGRHASKSPTNEQGAYKLTPTIPQGPHVPSPRLAPQIAPAGAPAPRTTRLPEPAADEDVKEKKSCCCIVM